MSQHSFFRRYAPQLLLFVGVAWMVVSTFISMNYVYYTWFFVYNDIGYNDAATFASVKQSVLQYGHNGRDVVGMQLFPILLMFLATVWSCRRTAKTKNVAEQVGAPNPLPAE